MKGRTFLISWRGGFSEAKATEFAEPAEATAAQNSLPMDVSSVLVGSDENGDLAHTFGKMKNADLAGLYSALSGVEVKKFHDLQTGYNRIAAHLFGMNTAEPAEATAEAEESAEATAEPAGYRSKGTVQGPYGVEATAEAEEPAEATAEAEEPAEATAEAEEPAEATAEAEEPAEAEGNGLDDDDMPQAPPIRRGRARQEVEDDDTPEPLDGERSGTFIQRMWLTGNYSPDEIVEMTKRFYPDRKTTTNTVFTNYNMLRNRFGYENVPPWPRKRGRRPVEHHAAA